MRLRRRPMRQDGRSGVLVAAAASAALAAAAAAAALASACVTAAAATSNADAVAATPLSTALASALASTLATSTAAGVTGVDGPDPGTARPGRGSSRGVGSAAGRSDGCVPPLPVATLRRQGEAQVGQEWIRPRPRD